jgi:predicted PurR-regulated permease PerM
VNLQDRYSLVDRSKLDTVSLVAAAVALYAVLALGLLSALLAGLLIAQLVHSTVPLLNRVGIANHKVGRAIALILLAAIITVSIALAIVAIWSRLIAGPENLFFLLQKMAEVIDTARAHLPTWASEYLPNSIEELEVAASKWLRENAWQLRSVGTGAGILLTHMVVGLIIGGMIAFSRDIRSSQPGPLTAALNLISNTVIVLVSFSVSPVIAIASLTFLVVIHKLEYFANARIIGTRINARAWELLLAMLIMDAWFGIPGLIAAPVYYAYLKDELAMRNLI